MPRSSEALRDELVEVLPRLRRFARALAGNVSDADDLVQIAVERALTRSDQLRDDAPLAGWIFGILRNAWIDEARGRTRRQRVFMPEELGEQVADTAAGHEEVLPVMQALQRLPDEQREVVVLVLIEGLSYREAAQIITVSIGAVTGRLNRGRASLQAMLGNVEQERS